MELCAQLPTIVQPQIEKGEITLCGFGMSSKWEGGWIRQPCFIIIIIFLTNIAEFGICTLLVILAKPSRGLQIFVGFYLGMQLILTKLNLFRNGLLWGLIAGNTMSIIQHEKGRDSNWNKNKELSLRLFEHQFYVALLRRTVIPIQKFKMFRFHTG